MDIENFKHIVGKAEHDRPAIIRFFGTVNEENCRCFNEEFLWLQNFVKPSKIVVMINSEGGSVLYGMGVFSIIQSCPIEVDCIIEGIAASMGSVIWAAGDNLFMHDYSLLMIHNPFNCGCDKIDPNTEQMVNAFRSQLETIYRKRFGMTKDQVKKIMDGDEGVDGTFFTSKGAVEAGFLAPENIIKTSKNVRDKVKNQIEGVDDHASLRGIMSSILAEIDENKLLEAIGSIRNRNEHTKIQDKQTMEQNETMNFDTISAQLGIAKDAQTAAVQARITSLLSAEASLTAVQGELNDLKIQFAGKETELKNVKSELDAVKASLKKYQDAEKAAMEAEIIALVDAAISDGKIENSAKAQWVEMAHTNLALVKNTLASIQARDNIAEQIAQDPANVSHIEATLKTAEEKAQAAIEAHLGKVVFEKF